MFFERSFRIANVCRLTGLCRTTIYAAIRDGDLRAHKSPGDRYPGRRSRCVSKSPASLSAPSANDR